MQNAVVYSTSVDAAQSYAETLAANAGWDVWEAVAMGDVWAEAWTGELAFELGFPVEHDRYSLARSA